ncbi:MAG: hypothetical protein JO154_19685 [Chitinophaga sp.]|uniref:ABC-three component system middle component 2 n=1 Tax=Chitinophaga sp. TaxID=1869181 RepID=UPI0025C5E974|nr:ABC-three component system middle component 2 [Chitinophaga sp.]MBV8254832.1 hypothetical protein [Chitinophaga sp.]
MEKIIELQQPVLFNSTLETGVRATIILNAYYPKLLSLSALVLMDHLVVHTQDMGGPTSLHVNLPHRGGELLVRREVIEQGTAMMRRLGLINLIALPSGFYFQASEEALPFIRLLKSKYNVQLKERAQWLAENIGNVDDASIEKLINQKINRWELEFYNIDN